MVGPVMAMLIRYSGGNYSLIASVGLIFEAISFIAIWFLIKKHVYGVGKEEEEEPVKGKSKGKRPEPNV